MPLKVTMRRADTIDMSDLSRLLDDVYSNGPARTPAQAPPPAPAPEAPEAELPWESATTMDEAFADWVPGPDEAAPRAERELFELADDAAPAPAAPASVLDHVFSTDEPFAPVLGDDVPAPLADLFADDDVPAAAPDSAAPPAPAPAYEPPAALAAALAGDDEPTAAFAEALADAPAAAVPAPAHDAPGAAAVDEAPAAAVAAPARPLAYEPPATLAEALLDAPDEPPADLRPAHGEDDWALAGLAPRAEHVPAPAEPAVLATTWRRDHDDLLPTRGRGRRR